MRVRTFARPASLVNHPDRIRIHVNPAASRCGQSVSRRHSSSGRGIEPSDHAEFLSLCRHVVDDFHTEFVQRQQCPDDLYHGDNGSRLERIGVEFAGSDPLLLDDLATAKAYEQYGDIRCVIGVYDQIVSQAARVPAFKYNSHHRRYRGRTEGRPWLVGINFGGSHRYMPPLYILSLRSVARNGLPKMHVFVNGYSLSSRTLVSTSTCRLNRGV